MRILLISMFMVVLGGCEDRFRYACQDPSNWGSAECKPPACTASGTCPDQLVNIDKEKK
jgi:hypothetical protein